MHTQVLKSLQKRHLSLCENVKTVNSTVEKLYHGRGEVAHTVKIEVETGYEEI